MVFCMGNSCVVKTSRRRCFCCSTHSFQNNGTLLNYNMYHGGTNFERTSGGSFITTSHDYDSPIDECGLLRQHAWGHLKDLHKAIKLCEVAMVETLATTLYQSKPGP